MFCMKGSDHIPSERDLELEDVFVHVPKTSLCKCFLIKTLDTVS